ncbi:transglutaminase family protein [Nocardiopsis trehalosi]|uniref:transglutaminase family protein n=1 Tax=Nocardiopsis trehalosi TaxID=109329 RepID=UPI000833D5C2|nr:DUF3488 and transglutaminase-like domain-containing protein [Nocardiopsis trehalosi]
MIGKAVLTAAAAAVIALALPALSPLVTGSGWWSPALLAVVLVAAAGAVLRFLPVAVAVLPAVQAVLVLCALTAVFAADTAVLGAVPTGGSLTALLDLFTAGRAEIDVSPPPVSATPGVVLVIAAGVGLAAIVADFLAVTARMPALVALPLAALLAVPLVVHDAGLDRWAFALAAAGYVLLLAVDAWVRGAEWGPPVPAPHDAAAPALGGLRHAAAGAGIAAAAIAPALLLPLAWPGLGSGALYDLAAGTRLGGETITTTHPLVSLRRDLAATGDRPVLEYTTTADRPEYLRSYVLDAFDGENWTMSPIEAAGDTLVGDDPLPAPAGRTGDPGATVATSVTLDARAAPDFLPLPYPARELAVDGDWFADPDSLMVFTTGEPRGGLAYRVESLARQPDAADLDRAAGPPQGLDARYLDVPGGVDPRVAELAETLTADAATPHERAVALQDWFTTDDRFTYDLRPPGVPPGADPLPYFLFDSRVGYCEQFAAAMTLMARQVGIPARVAVGYTAGTPAGDGRWRVSSSDAHAWPELYFEGQGWLRFEPTPSSAAGQGTASVPPYAAPAEAAPEEPAASAAPEDGAPEDTAEESAAEEEGSAAPQADAPGADTAAETAPGGAAAWWPAVPAAAGVLLLAAAPALVRALVRRARWARAAGPPARAHAAWAEVRDDAVDLGVAWNPAESPRSAARRIAAERGLTGAGRAALDRVALAEESARYAPEPEVPAGLAADTRTARAALRASAGRPARLRALLLPRSLLRRTGAPAPRPRPTPAP